MRNLIAIILIPCCLYILNVLCNVNSTWAVLAFILVLVFGLYLTSRILKQIFKPIFKMLDKMVDPEGRDAATFQAFKDAEDAKERLRIRAQEEYAMEVMIRLGYLKSEDKTTDEFGNALAKFSRDYSGIADKDLALGFLYPFWRDGLPAEEIPLRHKSTPEQKDA